MLKTHHCVVLVCGVGFGSLWGADGPSGEGPTGSGLGRAYCGLDRDGQAGPVDYCNDPGDGGRGG